MQCPICLNQDERYFYTFKGRTYCRKCITYYEKKREVQAVAMNTEAQYHLEYSMTHQQKEIAEKLLVRYQQGYATKLKAVCGAGKTEILYDVITYALRQGHRVCLTIPRRELVKELAVRIQSQFSQVTCSVVYGGHTEHLHGQLVICTCHQLFRFPKAFDLLILDEEDAFPYKGDEVLQNIVKQSIKGQSIFMSATLPEQEANFIMHTRYHGYPLPVPICKIRSPILARVEMIYKVRSYWKCKKPVLIYVSCIEDTDTIQKWFTYCKIPVDIAHSKSDQIQENIQKLKEGKIAGIVTTTILERGITIENVQVIVLDAEQRIYDSNTLLQICGRVGRKIAHPDGDITFYATYKTKGMKTCIKTILEDNAYIV